MDCSKIIFLSSLPWMHFVHLEFSLVDNKVLGHSISDIELPGLQYCLCHQTIDSLLSDDIDYIELLLEPVSALNVGSVVFLPLLVLAATAA